MTAIARPHLTPAISLTVASAIAFAPLLAGAPAQHTSISPPHPAMPSVTLSAAVNPADIDKLIDNLNAALSSATDTVTGLVGAPGQTLVSALSTASDLNDSLWKQLSDATDNAFLRQVLAALKASSHSGLTSLAGTLESANSTVVLTTGQVADLLSSVVTGSLSTALHAVADLLNNPLALSSYTGLIGVPLGVAGLTLTEGLTAVRDLGLNGLSLASTLVTGVTAQINHALSAFNGVVKAAKTLLPNDLIAGALTAVQGIVAAPVTAAVAVVDGGAEAITGALGTVVSRLAAGASGVVQTWLGDGTDPGALQRVINTVGAAPLSPASYTQALGILVGAGVSTGTQVLHSVSSLASVPFTFGADVVHAGADVITKLASATASVASGLLQAVGLPSYIHNLPFTVAKVFNAAVQTAATVTAAALNTIGTALNIRSAITGTVTGSNVVTLSTAGVTSTRSLKAAAAEEPAVGESAADLTQSTGKTASADTTADAEPAEGEKTTAEASSGADATATEDTAEPGTAAVGVDTTAPAADAAPDKPSTHPVADTPKAAGDSAATSTAGGEHQSASTSGTDSADDGSPTRTAGGDTSAGSKPATATSTGSKTATASGGADDSAASGGSPKRGAAVSTKRAGALSEAPASAGKTTTPRAGSSQPKHALGATEGGRSVGSIKSRLAHESQTSAKSAEGASTQAAA